MRLAQGLVIFKTWVALQPPSPQALRPSGSRPPAVWYDFLSNAFTVHGLNLQDDSPWHEGSGPSNAQDVSGPGHSSDRDHKTRETYELVCANFLAPPGWGALPSWTHGLCRPKLFLGSRGPLKRCEGLQVSIRQDG